MPTPTPKKKSAGRKKNPVPKPNMVRISEDADKLVDQVMEASGWTKTHIVNSLLIEGCTAMMSRKGPQASIAIVDSFRRMRGLPVLGDEVLKRLAAIEKKMG